MKHFGWNLRALSLNIMTPQTPQLQAGGHAFISLNNFKFSRFKFGIQTYFFIIHLRCILVLRYLIRVRKSK